jgi:hypothetical protein
VSIRAHHPYEGWPSSRLVLTSHSGWQTLTLETSAGFEPACTRFAIGPLSSRAQGHASPRTESNRRPRRSERRALSPAPRGHDRSLRVAGGTRTRRPPESQSGALTTELRPPCVCAYPRRASNPRPAVCRTAALPVELLGHVSRACGARTRFADLKDQRPTHSRTRGACSDQVSNLAPPGRQPGALPLSYQSVGGGTRNRAGV